MEKGYNVIIFSSVDWNESWQMHHQLAKSHGERGDRVLFVNNLGVRSPSIRKDWNRIVRKARETLKSDNGFSVESEAITVLSPVVLPKPYGAIPQRINSHILRKKIETWLRCSKRRSRVVVYTFLPTPVIVDTCLRIQRDALVYFCANRMAGTHPEKQKLLPHERRLIEASDSVIVISSSLREYILDKKPDCLVAMIRPGLDEEFAKLAKRLADEAITTKPDDLKSYPEPYIGYVGSISTAEDVFDKELVKECARQNKDATFVLIGECYGNQDDLLEESNIVLLGKKEHTDIPGYLQFFAAGLLPYKVSSYTDSVSPCKVNEYLAFGLPVVSTGIKEMTLQFRDKGELVEVCNTSDEFVSKVRDKVRSASGGAAGSNRAERIQAALKSSWTNKFIEIEKLLDGLSQAGSRSRLREANIVLSAKLQRASKRRRITLGLVGGLASAYWLLMHSSLLESWSAKLAIQKRLEDESTLVLVAGDGEGSFWNRGVVSRAADLEALKVEESQIKRVILVSPRYSVATDLSLLEAFVRSKTPEDTSVEVIERYAGCTVDNARGISEYLVKTNAKNVAVMSSKHHTRRIQYLLRSISDGRYTVKGISNQDEKVVDGNERIKLVKILAYETSALLLDWIKWGRPLGSRDFSC